LLALKGTGLLLSQENARLRTSTPPPNRRGKNQQG
jgi:hypothetical protein